MKKIVQTYTLCEVCQGKPYEPMVIHNFDNKGGTKVCYKKCPVCKGTGLRVKKKVTFIRKDDRRYY